MKKSEIQNTVRMGLIVPARYFKRSAWVNVERVMEYLVKKGLVVRKQGDIKYAKKSHDISVEALADAYYHSPLVEHIEEMRKLSADLQLPLNSGALLKAFNNVNI